jgi:signal transduction histidine kinase
MLRLEFRHNNTEYWEFIYPVMENNNVAGLITITTNFSQYRVFMSAVRSRTLVILVVGLMVMLVSINIYTEITIRRPVARIVAAMEDVRRSNFDIRVNPHSTDEIGQLSGDFNRMTQALGEAQQEIIRQNRILEKRVNEATQELRARNVELYQAQNQLRRASRLATAGQIAAMLAHDLGSPLSSISGHLQLMLEDTSRSPEEQQRLNLILNQVERLSDTIRNFLSSVSGFEAHFTDCDLNALLQHLMELTGPLLTERKISAHLSTDTTMPLLKADANQLQQLFLNLMTNAMDAMRDGGDLRVSTAFAPETIDGPGQAVVKVEDTGMGMDLEQQKNLFRPFFSTKEFGKGTGLGLAICREIVKIHGGQISVQSAPEQGTTITIAFPAGAAHHQSDAEKTEPAYRG